MAAVFDTEGVFVVKRLRTTDATFLAGASRAETAAPRPVATAWGPDYVFGPSGVVGANDWWTCTQTVPGTPDVCWVLVKIDPYVARKPAAGAPQSLWTHVKPWESGIAPQGGAQDQLLAASSGTYTALDALTGAAGGNRSLFLPIDPEYTNGTWTISVSLQGPAGGWAVDDLALYTAGIRLVGYPTNMWGTGDIWDQAKYRGS